MGKVLTTMPGDGDEGFSRHEAYELDRLVLADRVLDLAGVEYPVPAHIMRTSAPLSNIIAVKFSTN